MSKLIEVTFDVF